MIRSCDIRIASPMLYPHLTDSFSLISNKLLRVSASFLNSDYFSSLLIPLIVLYSSPAQDWNLHPQAQSYCDCCFKNSFRKSPVLVVSLLQARHPHYCTQRYNFTFGSLSASFIVRNKDELFFAVSLSGTSWRYFVQFCTALSCCSLLIIIPRHSWVSGSLDFVVLAEARPFIVLCFESRRALSYHTHRHAHT